MKISKILGKTFIYVVMIFTIIVSIFPIIWVIMSAFKTNAQILSSPFSLPTSVSFEPFAYLFDKYDFSYVLEHYFDDNGVKDSAPEELKAEFKDVEFRRYPENGCL